MDQKPIRIAITGAAGEIAYPLIQSLCKGDIFGQEQMLILNVVDNNTAALQQILVEINDLANHVVEGYYYYNFPTSLTEAFKNVDVVILIASTPHRQGMTKGNVLQENKVLFEATAEALLGAKRSVRVLVAANPYCYTNAQLLYQHYKGINMARYDCLISPFQFTALSMLSHNHTVEEVARKLNCNRNHVKNIIIWGNQSSTVYPDVSNALFKISEDAPYTEVTLSLNPNNWVTEELLPTVRNRLQNAGATSTGKAIADHLRYWMCGTPPDTHVSMAVPSNMDYGIRKGVFFSYPVTISSAGELSIVPGLEIEISSRTEILGSYEELKQELDDLAKHLKQLAEQDRRAEIDLNR